MKIATFLLFIGFMQVSAAGLAQKVTLVQKDITLKQVFKEINKQTGYNIFWSDSQLSGQTKINANFNNTPLRDVIDKCLENTQLTYVVQNKTVVIKPKGAATPNNGKPVDATTNAEISGTVVDSLGSPLVGATVMLLNTKYSVVSDEEGTFKFKSVPTGKYLLTVTYIGYRKVTRAIDLNGTDVNFSVTMHLEAGKLGEVVVSNGYQQIPQERATGSFDVISNELFNREVSSDVISRLDGIASGVYFDKRQGGTTPQISDMTIRGFSTLNANALPLVVVDNFEYNGNINDINPNDVLNITFLKDAAAASIWGARAGNGVIIITTKRGNFNQATRVTLNENVTITGKPNLFENPNWMSSSDFINVEQYLFQQGFYNSELTSSFLPVSPVVNLLNEQANGTITASSANSQINAFRNQDVRNDLLKYFYRNQVAQQYSINISGGNDKSSYYLSAGYDKNLANEVGNSSDRVTLDASDNFRPTKNLEITGAIKYTQSNGTGDNTLGQISMGGNVSSAIYPYARLADQNGNPLPIIKDYSSSFVQQAQQNGFLNWQFYPLQELENGWNTNSQNAIDVVAQAGARYTIIPGLTVDVKYQYQRDEVNGSSLKKQESYAARNLINEYSTVSGNTFQSYNIPLGGILSTSSGISTGQNGRAQLSYNKNWGKNSISAIGGGEISDFNSVTNPTNILYGYDSTVGIGQIVNFTQRYPLYPSGSSSLIGSPGASILGADQRFVSVFANASYTYDNKYTFSGSARRDASNLFGVNTNNKWKPLWSSGFKWDISNESFYSNSLFSKLALRVTYGYSGNVDNAIAAVPTLSYQDYPADLTNAAFAQANNPPVPNLRWENIGMLNSAVDFTAFNGRLSGSIEYYFKNAKDLIAPVPLDPTAYPVNSSPSTKENYANLKGHGVDVQLSGKVVDSRLFKWQSNILLSYYKDKLVKYYGPTTIIASDYAGQSLQPSPRVGLPLETAYAYKWGGLDNSGNPQGYLNGQLSEDYQGIMNAPASSLVYEGTTLPLFHGLFGNTFIYKNISLSANISYEFGFVFQKSTINYYTLFNGSAMNSDFDKRWQKPGDQNYTTVPSMDYPADQNRDAFYANSQPNFLNGNNIRLHDIRFDYNFQIKRNQLGISTLKLYLYLNNVGILWRANNQHLDPDYGGAIPPSRSLSFGVNATF